LIRKGGLEAVRQRLETAPQLLEGLDSRGSTPLVLAAYYGHGELVALLLEKGAKVDTADAVGNTALMGVCFKGYLDIAQQLIGAGSNVNHSNSMGATCLLYAVSFDRRPMAELLLAHGA